MTRAPFIECVALVGAVLLAGCADAPGPSSFIARVVSFTPGEGGGYGADHVPDIVLGAPQGAGTLMGSLDTLSLGRGGEVTVELGEDAVDHPGPDLVVFENPFWISGIPGRTYVEPAFVSVSPDGATYVDFPCDPAATPDYPGCAGIEPVFSADGGPSPFDGPAAGGDPFDLATIGVARARFVRIRDAGVGASLGGGKDGFDLDAIAVLP